MTVDTGRPPRLRAVPVHCAVGALVGARVGLSLGHGVAVPVAVGAVVLAVVMLACAARVGLAARWRLVATAVATTAATCGLAVLHLAATGSPTMDAAARRGTALPAVVRVATEPRSSPHGWWALVTVERLDGVPVGVRALLRGRGEPPALWTSLAGRTSVRHPRGTERAWLAGGHARYVLAGPDLATAARAPPVVARVTEQLRGRLRDAAARALPAARAGLAVGLVTGDTRLLPARVAEDLRAAGLSHLVAVSGSNVALVLAGVHLLGALVTAGFWTRWWAMVTVLVVFAVLTRFEPSVLRAATMAGLVLLAAARGHLSDGRHALAVALLVVLLVDPLLAGSLGLLLSVAATAGVLVVAPALRRRLPTGTGATRWAWDALAVTTGAQVAVLPLLVAGDGVPLVAVPANLAAVPVAAVASSGALVAAVLVLPAPALAEVVLAVTGPVVGLLPVIARTAAGRGPVLALHDPDTLAWAGVVALALLARRCRHVAGGRATLRRAAPVVGVVVLVLVATTGSGPGRPALRVTALDVGQGDAVLLRTPGATVLVDTGPGAQVAGRHLRRLGVDHLDLLVLTHGDRDHVGGLDGVLRAATVDVVWMRPGPDDPTPTGVPVAAPVAGQSAHVGDLRVDVLSPGPGRPFGWADAASNEHSIVLRVTWRGRRVLVTGDVERHAQQALLDRGVDLGADVLLVPHHGSRTSLDAFLAAAAAPVAIVSVGRDNRHGHPVDTVLATLRDAGSTVRRTDLEGDVEVVLAPSVGHVTVGR